MRARVCICVRVCPSNGYFFVSEAQIGDWEQQWPSLFWALRWKLVLPLGMLLGWMACILASFITQGSLATWISHWGQEVGCNDLYKDLEWMNSIQQLPAECMLDVLNIA